MGAQYPPPPPSQQPAPVPSVYGYPQPLYAPAPPRRPVWPWLIGGCAALAFLGIVGGVVLILLLAKGLQAGTLNCYGSDFPAYPNQTVQNVNTFQGTGGSSCHMVVEVNADSATATAYYTANLNSGDWVITGTDQSTGIISFKRRSNPKVHGTVELLGHGSHTQVQIEVVTDR